MAHAEFDAVVRVRDAPECEVDDREEVVRGAAKDAEKRRRERVGFVEALGRGSQAVQEVRDEGVGRAIVGRDVRRGGPRVGRVGGRVGGNRASGVERERRDRGGGRGGGDVRRTNHRLARDVVVSSATRLGVARLGLGPEETEEASLRAHGEVRALAATALGRFRARARARWTLGGRRDRRDVPAGIVRGEVPIHSRGDVPAGARQHRRARLARKTDDPAKDGNGVILRVRHDSVARACRSGHGEGKTAERETRWWDGRNARRRRRKISVVATTTRTGRRRARAPPHAARGRGSVRRPRR